MTCDPFDDRCRRCGTPLLLEFDPYGAADSPREADEHCDRCMDPQPGPSLLERLRQAVANVAGVVALLRWMAGR